MMPLFFGEIIFRVLAYIFIEVLFEGVVALFRMLFGLERKPKRGDKLELDWDALDKSDEEEEEDDV